MEKFIIDNIEVRELEDSLKIVAKVNDYGLSKTLRGKNGEFKEIVPKETWTRAIENNPNIKVYYNHQDVVNVADSVEFRIENDGVYADITLTKNADGLYKKVKENLTTGISFGFRALSDKFEQVGNFMRRTINEMFLEEISILDKTPAYNNTYAEVRAIEVPKLFDLELEKRKLELYKIK